MVDGENEDGLKDIKEDGNAELNDGDNFIHKPKRQDSTGQFSFNRQDSTTGQMGERQVHCAEQAWGFSWCSEF